MKLYELTIPVSCSCGSSPPSSSPSPSRCRCSRFHTWLPDAHVEAPTRASGDPGGRIAENGTYGFLRFAMALSPSPPPLDAADRGPRRHRYHLRALVAMVQKDLKKLVAYSSVSHLASSCWAFAFNLQGSRAPFSRWSTTHLHRGRSSSSRDHLRAASHPPHLRVRWAGEGGAGLRPAHGRHPLLDRRARTNGFVGEFLICWGVKVQKCTPFVAAAGVLFAAVTALDVPAGDVGKVTNEETFALPT